MIAPKMLLARFAALPDRLRAALVSKAEELGRALRERSGRLEGAADVSLEVASTADGVTVTIAMRSGPAARPRRAANSRTGRASVRPWRVRPDRFRPETDARSALPAVDAAFVAMGREIRAGLEMVVRRAFVP
jgi:hypothetical protein